MEIKKILQFIDLLPQVKIAERYIEDTGKDWIICIFRYRFQDTNSPALMIFQISSCLTTCFQILTHRRGGSDINPEAETNNNSSNSYTPRGGASGSSTSRRSGRRSAGTTPSSTPSPGRPGTGGPSMEEGVRETEEAAPEHRGGGEQEPHSTGMNGTL